MFRHGYAPCHGRHRRQVVPQIGRQLCGVYCGQPIPEDLGDGKGAISGGASTSAVWHRRDRQPDVRRHAPSIFRVDPIQDHQERFWHGILPRIGRRFVRGLFLAPRMTGAARAFANRFRSCQNCCRPTSARRFSTANERRGHAPGSESRNQGEKNAADK